MFIDAPEDCLILLEDVDAAFCNRADDAKKDKKKDGAEDDKEGDNNDDKNEDTENEIKNSLTFSGLLNAIDGVASAEGRILFMTTNYPEKLDAALIRPGRVDAKQHIGCANESQVERMFRRFHRNATTDETERFVKAVFDREERPNISMAMLQGLFLRYKRRPADVLDGLSLLYE